MKKLGMSKIGLKISGCFAVALLFISSTIILISFTLFRGVNTAQLESSAGVAHNVLLSSAKGQEEDLEQIAFNITLSSEFIDAAKKSSSQYIKNAYEILSGNKYQYAIFLDKNGYEIWKTDSAKLASYDATKALAGEKESGIYTDANIKLSYQYKTPIMNADKTEVIGALILGYDFSDTKYLDEVLEQTSNCATIFVGDERYSTTLLDETGVRAVGTTMPADISEKVITNGEEFSGRTVLYGTEYYCIYKPILDNSGAVAGAYFTGTPTAEFDSQINSIRNMTILIECAFFLIIAIVMMLIIRRIIDKPVKIIKTLADEMAQGNLDVADFNYEFAHDELGGFANDLEATKQQLYAYIYDITRMMAAMAEGDFSITSDMPYRGNFVKIKEAIDHIQQTLREMLMNINRSSAEVLRGSTQISEGSQLLAEGTARQASAIEELSATIAEISTNVQKNADDAEEAEKLSEQARQKIDTQNEEMLSMLDAMKEIENKSNQIGKIIKNIDDIAFQTNILALNAAVEAARAGDAGRGFAVVAEEVRELATKSAEAAERTTQLIQAAIDAVSNGASIAKTTATTMHEVMELSEHSNNYIIAISEATTEQNISIQQVTSGIEQISYVVQQNSATAEESAASCQELSGQSRILEEQVAMFKV